MKVKTYVFENVKEGMERIKEEYGPDTVIVSVNERKNSVRAKWGCEISIATDEAGGPDTGEQRELRRRTEEIWGAALKTINEKVADLENGVRLERVKSYPLPLRTLYNKMVKNGFSAGFAYDVISGVYGEIGDMADNSHKAVSQLRAAVAKRIRIENLVGSTDSILMLGPSGVGKTQTAKKVAGLCAGRGETVSLLAYDPVKKGSYDEFMAFSEKTGVPCSFSTNMDDLCYMAGRDRTRKIIDIAGNIDLQKEIVEKLPDVKRLVLLPAGARDEKIKAYCGRFEGASIAGLVFTKLDEEEKLGHLCHNLMNSEYPVCFLTYGAGVGEILVPDGDSFFKMLLGMFLKN